MGAKHYTQLWNKNKHTKKADLVPIEGVPPPAPIDDEEEFFEPDLDGNAPKRQSRPAVPRGPRRGGDRGRGSGRGSGRGADPPAPIVDGPPPTLHPVPAPGPGGGHGGDGGGEGGGEGGHTDEPAEEFFGGPDEPERRPRRARQGPEPIESIGGAPVVFDPYTTPSGVYTPNFVMYCTNIEHGDCHKRRGCTEGHERRHGVIEPLAWLRAWHEIVWPTRPGVKNHVAERVSGEAVDRWVAEHGAELRDVCMRAGR